MADPPDSLIADGLSLPRTLAATLVLVRHGESTWVAEGRFQGRGDPPLSDLGRQQAELVGERLALRDEQTPLPIPTRAPLGIWHSPLSRAAETARIIAARQPSAVRAHPTDALTEIAQGDWEGLPHAEVRSRWPSELLAWRRTPDTAHAPGGESLTDAAARVRGGVAEIIRDLRATGAGDRRPTSDTVGDDASLRHNPVPGYPTVTGAFDAPAERWAIVVAHDGTLRLVLVSLLGAPLARFWSFPFNLAAISVIALHEGVAALRAHNLSDHLAPLAAHHRAAEESRGQRRGAL